MNLKCERCNREYFIDPKNRRGHSKSYCNSCNNNYRKYEMMEKCLEYKGGKCILCGYDKCPRSLVFHHRDPSVKSFTISSNYNIGWPLMQAELDKCDLICANCHGEIHYKEDRDKAFSMKKKKNETKYYDKVCFNPECQKDFVTEVQSQSYCSSECRMYGTRKVKDRPSREELLKMIEESSCVAVGRKYRVTDSTIRKWLGRK